MYYFVLVWENSFNLLGILLMTIRAYWSKRRVVTPSSFSELFTAQRISHGIAASCLYFTYLPHHTKLQVITQNNCSNIIIGPKVLTRRLLNYLSLLGPVKICIYGFVKKDFGANSPLDPLLPRQQLCMCEPQFWGGSTLTLVGSSLASLEAWRLIWMYSDTNVQWYPDNIPWTEKQVHFNTIQFNNKMKLSHIMYYCYISNNHNNNMLWSF